MEIAKAEEAVALVKELETTRRLLERVEKKIAQWTRIEFQGEDGTESVYSVVFGGNTENCGKWERSLVTGLREQTISFLNKRIEELEREIENI